MNKVKKIMFVMIASLATMSLFSFKNAEVNEASFKNANVTAYASFDNAQSTSPAAFLGAIIKTAKKVWEKSSRDIVYVTTTIADFTGAQYTEYSTDDVSVKSQTLLAKL